jgi:putative immunity protein/bacteriocin
MFKNLKVHISMLLTIILVLTAIPVSAYAGDNNNNTDVVNVIQNILDEQEYAATAVRVDVDEAERIWGTISSKLNTIGYYEKLSKNNYHEKDDAIIDPVKIIDDKDNNLSVYYYMKIYEDNSKNMVATMFVYDVNTNSLLKVESNIITGAGDLERFFSFSEFNKPLTRGFSVWGQNFLCATTGLIACTAYCAMIGVLSAAVGITCSLVCGTAFNAACS